jgi:hypothetical protein
MAVASATQDPYNSSSIGFTAIFDAQPSSGVSSAVPFSVLRCLSHLRHQILTQFISIRVKILLDSITHYVLKLLLLLTFLVKFDYLFYSIFK